MTKQAAINSPRSGNELPLVSIVTVVYNNRKYLSDAMDSVKRQTYKNIEYLIIDGGSTDGTVELIESRRDEVDYFVSEPDGGIYDAMNKGIAAASGRYIGILNSDDWYEDNAIELLVDAFDTDPAIALAHGQMVRRQPTGELDGVYGARNGSLYRRTPFSHPTCMVRADVYTNIGAFDCKFPTAADYDFMIRFVTGGYKAEYVASPITNFRLVGITSSRPGPPAAQLYRVFRKHGVSSLLSVMYICRRLVWNQSARAAKKIGIKRLLRISGIRGHYRILH